MVLSSFIYGVKATKRWECPVYFSLCVSISPPPPPSLPVYFLSLLKEFLFPNMGSPIYKRQVPAKMSVCSTSLCLILTLNMDVFSASFIYYIFIVISTHLFIKKKKPLEWSIPRLTSRHPVVNSAETEYSPFPFLSQNNTAVFVFVWKQFFLKKNKRKEYKKKKTK